MENFIIIAVCVGLGILFRHIKAFPEQTAQVLNMFALYASLPAVILLKAPHMRFSSEMLVPALIPWAMLLLSAALIWLAGRRFHWSRETIGVLLLVVPIGNTSFMGVPMVNAFFGGDGLPYLIVYDQIGTMLIFVTFGSVVLAVYGGMAESKNGSEKGSGKKITVGGVLRQALLFPPTLALLIGLSLRWWPYPDALVRLLENMGGMMTPLVMTAIGFQLRIRLSPDILRPLAFGLAVKMAVAPFFALLLCRLMGWNGLPADIAVFEAGMPPMVTAGAMAIAAGLLPELAAGLVSLGMALAFFTLPVLYWVVGVV